MTAEDAELRRGGGNGSSAILCVLSGYPLPRIAGMRWFTTAFMHQIDPVSVDAPCTLMDIAPPEGD